MSFAAIPDGSTTYCWASNVSATTLQVDSQKFGLLGRGNGVVCPLGVSMTIPRSFRSGETLTIAWSLLQLDPSSGIPFLLPNVTQNVTTSQLFYCRGESIPCQPFLNAKALSSPIYFKSFQDRIVSFESSVEIPKDAGEYVIFATTTLATTTDNNRLDVALFTKVTIQAASMPNHTAMYVGIGVGAFVFILIILGWCWHTRRKVRELESELQRATFVSMRQSPYPYAHDSYPKYSFSSNPPHQPHLMQPPTQCLPRSARTAPTNSDPCSLPPQSFNRPSADYSSYILYPNYNSHPLSPSDISTDYSTRMQSFPVDRDIVIRRSDVNSRPSFGYY